MASSLTSKHIPTILGVVVLVAGLIGGIFLANSATTGFLPRASAETTPKNTKITNVSDTSFTVSWITDAKTSGYIKYGTSASSLTLTATDDRDQVSGSTGSFQTHHVTVRGLSAGTSYYFKIGSSSTFLYDDNGQPYQTRTVSAISSNAKTIYGQVLTSQQSGVSGAIVYITGDDLAPLSTLTQSTGSFVLSLSQARTKSLSAPAVLTDALPISVLVQGETQTSVVKATLSQAQPLPEIVLGTDQDLTNSQATNTNTVPTPTPSAQELQSKFTAQLLSPPTETIASSSAQLLTITSPVANELIAIRKPKMTGVTAKSTRVLLIVDGPTAYRVSTTANSTGNWTYTSTKSLLDGSYQLTAIATRSGQTETASTQFVVTVPMSTSSATATAAALPTSGTQEFSIAIFVAGILLVASGFVFLLESGVKFSYSKD